MEGIFLSLDAFSFSISGNACKYNFTSMKRVDGFILSSNCFVKLLCSYEDWGVDELIVEDSWKRQVGGD